MFINSDHNRHQVSHVFWYLRKARCYISNLRFRKIVLLPWNHAKHIYNLIPLWSPIALQFNIGNYPAIKTIQSQNYTWPGSNWRPSACEADVIATRPQVHDWRLKAAIQIQHNPFIIGCLQQTILETCRTVSCNVLWIRLGGRTMLPSFCVQLKILSWLILSPSLSIFMAVNTFDFQMLTSCQRGHGATAARLTPDQKVGSSNLSALIF